MLNQILETAAFIRAKVGQFTPEVGIVLGTGLGDFADNIEVEYAIEYKDIPNFPVSTVEGHKGRLIFGRIDGRRVVAMQGRFHYYEGYTMQQVTFPVRVLKQLGIRCLFVSNASGGINPSFRTGDLMIITDHINLMPNPLIGPNIAELGPRFPDMHNCYDKSLIAAATKIAEEENIKLQYGVYVGGTGPTFETQAEYRYFKPAPHRTGADNAVCPPRRRAQPLPPRGAEPCTFPRSAFQARPRRRPVARRASRVAG